MLFFMEEEGTEVGFAYTSHSEHFIKCDIFVKHCLMDYNESHRKSETRINILNILNNLWQSCDVCKKNSNKSSWNKHMKRDKTLLLIAKENET